MTPKKKNDSESANAKKGGRNPTSKGNEVKTPMTDPRLKSILPLIETQLIPIQEVITDFAKVMLDKTRALKSRNATVAKFRKPMPTIQTTATELPNPCSSLYIPKSARVKITLTYSKALANETEVQDLQEELSHCKETFGRKIAYIFERIALLEEKQEKTSRVQAFLSNCYKLIQGLVIIEKRSQVLETTLKEDRFNLWVLLVLLRSLKIRRVTEPNIFTDYLYMEYQDVKQEFIKLFLPEDPIIDREDESNIMTRSGTEDERNLVDQLIPQLKNLVNLATIRLQQHIDQEEEKQTVDSLITAQYKKAEIMKATEATALAIHDISTNGQKNMEQHLKSLIKQVLDEQTKTPSSKKPSSKKQQKNYKGDKKPRAQSPIKKNGEQKRKNPSFHYQIPENEENSTTSIEEVQPKPKKVKFSHHQTNQPQNKTYTQKQPCSKNGKRTSRRKEERSKRRWKKEQEQQIQKITNIKNKPVQDAILHTNKKCIQMYGFVADAKKPIWKNIPNALKTINATTYLQTPTNLLCHNLCKKLQPPTGFDQLLGLGLNYCIEEYHPKPNIKNTIEKLTRSIRLQAWIKEKGPTNDDNDYNTLHPLTMETSSSL
jgi:hypothetical protein